jgi:LmbE family N-acetylglucosaminyl deacetylase
LDDTKQSKAIAVIVAHPDDETLWAGGTLLSQPSWGAFIITLCRASDRDRAPRFYQALKDLGAEGVMGDLDDSPEQVPLAKSMLQKTILQLLPKKHFDVLISHSPAGEYTRHRRHEEVADAVISLWQAGKLSADQFWAFAYEDGGRQYLPRAIKTAHMYWELPEDIWQKKYEMITRTYGFAPNGFEAQTTPHAEAFWQFKNSKEPQYWRENKGFHHESSITI